MKLTVSDAADLLGVSEKAIYDWMKTRDLPAIRMNEEIRFNRSELLEWATAEGVDVSPRIFQDTGSLPVERASISEALARGGVHPRLRGKTPQETLRSVVGLLPLPPGVDREFLLAVLLAREALGSTAIGDGIAIPHVRNPIVLHVDEPLVSLCYLEQPVDFGALDGRPVHALFTLVTTTIRTHLHLLSRLSHLLQDGRFRSAVTKSAGAEEILGLAREIETAVESRRSGR
jgi:PTS system nitrogen regulatory IIA component